MMMMMMMMMLMMIIHKFLWFCLNDFWSILTYFQSLLIDKWLSDRDSNFRFSRFLIENRFCIYLNVFSSILIISDQILKCWKKWKMMMMNDDWWSMIMDDHWSLMMMDDQWWWLIIWYYLQNTVTQGIWFTGLQGCSRFMFTQKMLIWL